MAMITVFGIFMVAFFGAAMWALGYFSGRMSAAPEVLDET